MTRPPIRHHIDRRAGALAAHGSDDDLLLTTCELSEWLGVSTQWLEIGRTRNYGPRFTRVSERLICYRRADVVSWLRARSYGRTADYATPPRDSAKIA